MIEIHKIDDIKKVVIRNGSIEAEFLSFGARMTKLVYNGVDVLLGYDDPQDYLTDSLFIGATVGRFAGRIGNTRLTLGGKLIQLDQNENQTTCHHGGAKGFDKFYWETEKNSEHSVVFSRTSVDGEGGFPGNFEIAVQYTVLENGVEIYMLGRTNEETLANVTNHAYFNLSGYNDPDARDHYLFLPANHYLTLNDKLIPTGEIAKTDGTDFDFSREKKIRTDLDHYFIYDSNEDMHSGGYLYSEKTGIQMNIETNQPGVQIYTCGAFKAEKGKGGIPLHQYQGIALETQGYPDNPNHDFPSSLLKPNRFYISKTRFLFSQK